MSLIPEAFVRAVASIGVRNNCDIKWIGTGFFVNKPVDESKVQPFFITNKHVIEGKDSVVIRMKKLSTGELVVIDMPLCDSGEPLYTSHPSTNIDIVAVLINGGYLGEHNLDYVGYDIFRNAKSSAELREAGCTEGNDIFMLGYPMGMVDVESNTPICRSGCLARMDRKEIERTKNMLVDVHNFPGNSGSPILTKPEVVAVTGTKALSECVLAGIVHRYIPYQESLVNSQTHQVVEIRSENSGIAKVHPVEFIREVVELEHSRHIARLGKARGEKNG